MTSSIAVSTGLLRGYAPLRDTPENPRDWEAPLAMLAGLGADEIDFSQFWGALAELTDDQVQTVAALVGRLGLSTAGISIVDVPDGPLASWGDHAGRVRRTIEQAQMLGASHVSLGVHPMVQPSRSAPGPTGSARLHRDAALRFGEALAVMAEHATSRGVTLSLEMHESSVLCSSTNVLSLIDQAPALGSNPDLGNLIRARWPLPEDPYDTIVGLGGTIAYWHVKNGARFEVGQERFQSTPTTMELGSIDYRAALATAMSNGFDGPLVIEHYGGDTLFHARSAVGYLRGLVSDLSTATRPSAR